MMAKVNLTNRLVDSLVYGANELKGGEIFLQSGYILALSPEENARRWERMSNDYRNKAVHVILSFSDKDTLTLHAMPTEERIKKEQEMLREFLDVITKKGNNVKDCPFVCFHHDNTDNEHLHLYVLMTTWEGKRLDTSFIGKNADRAAARVSIRWNMESPLKAMQYEWKHMLKTGEITEDEMPDQLREHYNRPRPKRQHEWSADQNVINERLRRKQAIEEARKRKKCAFIITEAAKTSKDRTQFIEKLKAEGLIFELRSREGFYVGIVENERMYKYSFKQLNIDPRIVPYYEGYEPFVPREEWEAMHPRTEVKAGRRHDQAHSLKSSAQNEQSRGDASRPPLKPKSHDPAKSAGSHGENREYELGEREGYEESIRNESRMKM